MPIETIRPAELPYVTHLPKDGRSIPLIPLLDSSGVWHIYLQQPDGSLVAMQPNKAVATSYIADGSRTTSLDICLPLSDMIVQHFSFTDALKVLQDAEHDVINGLASIHRYFVLLAYAKAHPNILPHDLVSAELEFALANHRAFYDLLNSLFICLYKRFLIHNKTGQRVQPANIPDSFNKLIQKSDVDLRDKFYFPQPLVDFLRERQLVFGRLCKIRDNIMHHGHSPDFMYTLPDGFAMGLGGKMWHEVEMMNTWSESLLKPNRLGSVLAFLVFLVDDMMGAMAGLATALKDSFVALPDAIASGHRMYLRDPLVIHLSRIADYRSQHWFDPDVVLDVCHRQWSDNTTP
jgi:hypothetical protein